MRTRYFFAVLIVLLGCIFLSACDVPWGPLSTSTHADSSLGVTANDTSAGALVVTMVIDEDQDATDGMSNITLSFRTHAIEEDNFVIFDSIRFTQFYVSIDRDC